MGSGGAAGAGLSLAATGFKVIGDLTAAKATSAGDIFKAEELEQQAQYGELKATQTNAQMTRNLQITLGHIDAVRAAAHTDPSSPTGAAVRGEREEIGTEKKNITVANIEQQVRMDEANAAYLRSAAANAITAGDISAAGDFFSGLSGALGGPGGGGGGGGGSNAGNLFFGGGSPSGYGTG
jgi:membrane protein involved in colicin uptake